MTETRRIVLTRRMRVGVAVLGGMILLSGMACSDDSRPQQAEGTAKPADTQDEFYGHTRFEIEVREQSVGTFERFNRPFNCDTVTLPGDQPFETVVRWNKFSRDGQDWAIVYGDGNDAIINGMKVTLPDIPISPYAFQFLAGGRWVYVGDRCVVDGTEKGPQFDAIHGLLAHPPSGSVAYVASHGATSLVVHNGERHPIVGAVDLSSVRFSSDGRRLAYVAERDGNEVAVVDGRKVAFNGPTIVGRQILFSPDGKRFVFVAQDGATSAAVVDGRSDDPFERVVPLLFTFSPDGQQYAYIATESIDLPPKVVLNGREVAARFPVPIFTFSPDGHHFAYVELESEEGPEYVVIDEERGPAFESVIRMLPDMALDETGNFLNAVFGSILFSPNSKRHAYCVAKGGGQAVVVDGQVGPVYDRILWTRLYGRFSVDSQRFVYAAVRDGQCFVVNGGRESGPYLDLSATNFVVSHNGEHMAFAVMEPDPKDPEAARERVVVDGVAAGPSFGYIFKDSLILSPCGTHHAYVAQPLDDENSFAIIVDGDEVGRIENPRLLADHHHPSVGAKSFCP